MTTIAYSKKQPSLRFLVLCNSSPLCRNHNLARQRTAREYMPPRPIPLKLPKESFSHSHHSLCSYESRDSSEPLSVSAFFLLFSKVRQTHSPHEFNRMRGTRGEARVPRDPENVFMSCYPDVSFNLQDAAACKRGVSTRIVQVSRQFVLKDRIGSQ